MSVLELAFSGLERRPAISSHWPMHGRLWLAAVPDEELDAPLAAEPVLGLRFCLEQDCWKEKMQLMESRGEKNISI